MAATDQERAHAQINLDHNTGKLIQLRYMMDQIDHAVYHVNYLSVKRKNQDFN